MHPECLDAPMEKPAQLRENMMRLRQRAWFAGSGKVAKGYSAMVQSVEQLPIPHVAG